MARTKTLSAPRPRTVATRGHVNRNRKASVRRDGDRRESTTEGRRAEAARASSIPPPGARAPEPAAEKRPLLRPAAQSPSLASLLSEEEQIESSKYVGQVRERVFEEERFLFPETYGVDRVRLLVKDPEWMFAYWDLSARAVDSLRRELGERGMALTRLTLLISDPGQGGTSVILLPYGARAWYVRADSAPRTYRAQIGWTLPSGQFRLLAESNVVSTPRSGSSPEIARGRARFDAPADEIRSAMAGSLDASSGPWQTEPIDASAGGRKRVRGGASDVFRR
jgi:uncharacterized protein